MSDKEITSHNEQEGLSGGELQNEKTINTFSTGFEEEEDYKFGVTQALAFFSIALGFFSDVFVGTAVSSVLSTINKDIGPSNSYVWIISANYATVSITAPFIGRLGDIFGRRNLLILGNFIAGIGSLICALAPHVNAAIAGTVLIGLGSSMHQLGWACVGEIVPRKSRPAAMAIFECSITPASVFGSLIAFSLTEHTARSWRNIYWICVALNGAAFFLVIFCFHPVNQYIKEAGKTRWDQVKGLDYVGFSLFALGLCLFLIGLSFGGTTFPWKSAGTLAPMIIGVFLLIITALWEHFTHNPYNIFPTALLQNYRGFSIVTGVTFLVGMNYYSTLILWPLQVSLFYTQDSVKIGLYSMSLSLGAYVGAIISGFLLSRTNQARWILTGICLGVTAFAGAQSIVGINTHIASTVLVVLTGAVVSGATVASNSMIQLAVPHQYLGVAMGLVITARNVGGSISSTVYTVILNNQLTEHLGTNVGMALAKAGLPLADIPGVVEALATGNATSPAFATASPTAILAGILALKLTYVHAFKIVYLVSIAFGIVGSLCALFSKNVGEYMTTQVDVKMSAGGHIGLHEAHTGGHVIDHDGKELSEKRAVPAVHQQV